MSKCKILAFSAVAAAAVVAIVLCGKPSGEAEKGETVASGAIPEAEAALPVCQVALTPPASTNQTPTAHGTLPFVLTSAQPFTAPLRLAAESLGAKTVSVIARNALLVEVDEAARARLSADSRFEEIAEYLPAEKVQPELAALVAGGAESVDVSIVSLAEEYRPFVMSCLRSGGGEMLTGCINEGDTIRAKLPAALVSELSMRGDVRWMERYVRPQLMNDVAVNPQAMNVRTVWNTHGLTGKGQNISTSDSGIDTGDLATMHRDLRNRVKDIKVVAGCVSRDVIGHGTHTAGSIVGDGTESGGQIRGTAYEANLFAWFCSDGGRGIDTPTTMAALYTADGEWTTYIHSGSWGTSLGGQYDTECAGHDKYVWEHPEFLPVFSAGNEGPGARTIGAPAASKNVLTVGATQNLRAEGDGGEGNGDPTITASYSSRGPCQDGRIKPDVAAPGTGVLSTRAHGVDYSYGIYDEFYAYDTGTSMACPLTAGAVALVRQWLVERKGFADEDGQRPTAALMKAVIMGGAKDADVPRNNQGWGRVDLEETLFPSQGRTVKLIDRIPFEQGFVTNIVIETTNAAPLDVQLVWVDYPGSASGSQKAARLVNDLDLTVEARIAGQPTLRYGNGGTAPDTLNNAESVRITSAAPTKYVITVDCKTIVYDHTKGGAAALYIRGAFDPDAAVEEPAYVHLKMQDRDFMSLDRALEAVRDDGETVEIRDWVTLGKPVTLTNSCTIVATNADAAVAYVSRLAGASLTVAPEATVMLSNVVFAASADTLVSVEAGGCLKLGPQVNMGVGLDHVAVKTADAKGFELAGALSQKFLFQCAGAARQGDAFGTYSCDAAVATRDAVKIVCADDIDRETRGAVGAGRTLVWKVAEVPLDEASGYYVDDTGKTNTAYRMEKALGQFKSAYDAESASEFIALKDGTMAISFDVKKPLAFRGEGDPRPVLTAESTSGFTITEGGSLVVSNLVFSGYIDDNADDEAGFIYVAGGSLTLGDGAMLEGMTGKVCRGSGIIDLFGGTVTLAPGSAIFNCLAEGGNSPRGTTGGFGGAIYIVGAGSVLNMSGCRISNCSASAFGGAVFVDEFGELAEVNVSGEVDISGNFSDNSPISDNVCFWKSSTLARFRLVDDVTGTIGIWCETHEEDMPTGNEEGDAFIVNTLGAAVSETTLRSFVCDADETLMGAVGEDGMLVWVKMVDDGQCAPGDAVALLIDADGVTNYYASVARAFAYMGDNSPYAVEMLADDVLADFTVRAGCDVTLRGAAEAGSVALTRDEDVGIVVPADASLTLENVALCGFGYTSALIEKSCISVEGGALTLAAGVRISDIFGNASRAANAVTVSAGGTFTMMPGAEIVRCENEYSLGKEASETQHYGVGGGVLVDGGSTAHLCGGEISECRAMRGGGVCVCNGSVAYVSGKMRIAGNYWLDHSGAPGSKESNLLVEDNSELYVDGELTDKIGTGDFLQWQRNTNLVAQVSADWAWGVDALTNSAAQFSHDSLAGVVGVAVTNGTAALIVWSSAVTEDARSFTYGGVTYALAGELPAPPPVPQYTVTTNTPGPLAFTAIAHGETCTVTLEDLVAGAKYSLYRTNSLAGGFSVEGVAPFTNFTAEADGPLELELPLDELPVFWRATGEETYTTNYFNK